MQKFLILPIFFLFIFTSCSSKNQSIEEIFQKSSFSQIEGFFEDDLDFALEVFKKDCQKSKRFEELKNVCAKAMQTNDAKMFFVSNFIPYKLYDENLNDKGIITGYYEPLLYGSLEKTQRYKYPIYKIPKNMILSDDKNLEKFKYIGKIVDKKILPYDTRKEIEENTTNPNLEAIVYVDDKIDLFFLHIQGSGKIQLTNGEMINLGYAGQNGRAYTSIGKYFIEKELISKEEVSVQKIKEELLKNPSKIDEILNLNESYVFFELRNEGATGALGSVLSPKRNLAVDKKYIQLGLPVFINTKNPITKEAINQLMIAADVGGAIKGQIRADFFWGFGEEALKYAGVMKELGQLYVLKPKD